MKQSQSKTEAFYFLSYVYKLWYAYHSLPEGSMLGLAKPAYTWPAASGGPPGLVWALLGTEQAVFESTYQGGTVLRLNYAAFWAFKG